MTDKSAFPSRPTAHGTPEPGMTFRDWQWTQFAAAAIQGQHAHPESTKWDERQIALVAYRQADQMIIEIERREKGDE